MNLWQQSQEVGLASNGAVTFYFPGPLVPAVFIKRLHRFAALVEKEGQIEEVHVPSSGRMAELLTPGRQVWLYPTAGRSRLRWRLMLVKGPATWVCIDSLMPNRLFAKAIQAGTLCGWEGFVLKAREYIRGNGKFDFLLGYGNEDWLVEIKSVTLVRDGIGLFPDAPTVRGTRHLMELAAASREGRMKGAVIFVHQRADCVAFAPHAAMDAAFASALRWAIESGVRVEAWRCLVTPSLICWQDQIPLIRSAEDCQSGC